MNKIILSMLLLSALNLSAQEKKDPNFAGNPVFPGWYADRKELSLETTTGYFLPFLMKAEHLNRRDIFRTSA